MDKSLSEYELLRLKNIKRNHEFLKSLGLPVPAIPTGLPCRTRKPPTKKRKTLPISNDSESPTESSDDSDEDWVPGSEEAKKRKKMIKRFIPDFRSKPQTVPDRQRQEELHKMAKRREDNDSSAFDELGQLGDELDFLQTGNITLTQNQTKRLKGANKQSRELQRIQYDTRGKKYSYCEAEVPDDDHYIFCEECQDLHYGDCPVHGPLHVVEDKIRDGNSDLTAAVASTPNILRVGQSSIPGAGLGVFSTTLIPKGARFGPYKGRKIGLENVTDKTNTSYFWEIVKDGKFDHFLDGGDESHSNWMRFVNCSRCEDEQNLVAFQFRGNIYYRTYKPIHPGKELLVWYGESYATDLGISTNANSQDHRTQKKTNGNSYTCEGCGMMYTSFNFLQRHRNYCLTRTICRTWDCEMCGKKFASSSYFEMHMCARKGGKSYQRSRELRLENQTERISPLRREKPYKCAHCNEAFINSSNLTSHLRTHTGEKPYQCTQCNKAFNQLSHLTRHLRTHTGEKPYQCTLCNKAFNQLSTLTRHLRTHTGEKPYQCTQCNKAFNQLSNLTTHLRTHTGEKPYQCTQCNKAFNRLSHLTRHLRTHTGEKPYQCTQCNKAFNRLSNLTTHLRTHTGEKPYQCTQCNKAFSRSSTLTTHLRTHTGEKPYQCTEAR